MKKLTKKKRLYLVVSGVALVGLVVVLFILLRKPQPVVVFKENITIEYGATLTTDSKKDSKDDKDKADDKSMHSILESIDSEKSTFDTIVLTSNNTKEISEATFDTKSIGKKKGTIYATLGAVEKGFEFSYEVVDTQFPVITGVETIEIEKGVEPDYSVFKATDPVDGDLKVQITGDYDINNPGEYSLTAIAEDKNKNSTKFEFNLIVKEETIDDSNDDDSSGTTNGGIVNNVDTPTYIGGHIIVNKKYRLPSSYNPGEDWTAGESIRWMIGDMQAAGLNVSNYYSGFRDYEHQEIIYNRYVNNYGRSEADTFSARPGHSEHQTGLVFDLCHQDGSLIGDDSLDYSWEEVEWIANNAHKYGFIVRYQSGKEAITGYQPEPWHLRYVGSDAESIWQSGLTLEEYLGFEGGDY